MLNGTRSPPLHLVFCSLLKKNFTKESSKELQDWFLKGLPLFLPLSINIPVFHIFSSFFLQSQTVHLCLRFSIKAFISILFPSHLSPFFPLLFHLFSLWFMIRAERIKRYIANWFLLFIPISALRLYRSVLSLCMSEYACVGVDKVLLWRPFATADDTRRDLCMTF